MTRYINVKVNISEGQKEKLQHAIKANCSTVSIHLGHEDLQGNDILAVYKYFQRGFGCYSYEKDEISF